MDVIIAQNGRTEQSHSIRMNKNAESTSNNAPSVDLLDAPSHPKLKKITRKKEIRFIRAMCELDDANHCIVEEVTCQLCKVITDGTINHSRSKMHVNNLMKCHDSHLCNL
ncbi:hypothetical protein GE061_004525 [Apolygus lucorum]|uniref:Uncharacterized protein n=1 Tax=Apolygus lucorum TaxID=248454 RepID=A0A8S9WZJ3_APOLU|nr:hypothetical protein GE061_004525 [Apolygus lucorum]